jgi:hypothetical protein
MIARIFPFMNSRRLTKGDKPDNGETGNALNGRLYK